MAGATQRPPDALQGRWVSLSMFFNGFFNVFLNVFLMFLFCFYYYYYYYYYYVVSLFDCKMCHYRVRTHPGKPGKFWNLINRIPVLEYTVLISSKVLENTGI